MILNIVKELWIELVLVIIEEPNRYIRFYQS